MWHLTIVIGNLKVRPIDVFEMILSFLGKRRLQFMDCYLISYVR